MSNISRRYRATQVLRTIREQGRSVTWLASRVGVSRQYTSDVCHGHKTASAAMAEGMAAALGVPLFLLFDVSGETSELTDDTDEEAAA